MNKAQRCGARACSGFVRQACGCGRDCSQAANPWAGCVLILALILPVAGSAEACHGRFPNPLTDVCWRCIFPIHIGPARISMGMEDAGAAPPLICTLPGTATAIRAFRSRRVFLGAARVAEVVRTRSVHRCLAGSNSLSCRRYRPAPAMLARLGARRTITCTGTLSRYLPG